MTHLHHIGLMVRRMREHRGMTQDQLSERAGIRRATVADIELGKSNFEINTLVSIAKALECDLDVMLTPAT